MQFTGATLGVLLVALSAGCAGSSARVAAPNAPPTYHRQSVADTSSPVPNPAVRPGLATEWGETRSSRVRGEHFARASASPFASVAIRYNDAPGAAHQAAYRQSRQSPVQYTTVYGDGIRVSVIDELGSPLPAYLGGDTMYIIGSQGQRYAIVLTNVTPARFEAVVTVDGIDVINGQPGAVSNRGYLLPPHGTLRIEGFRQSSSQVAAFRFGAVADSYAAQRGDARNVGVIGVALFAEVGWVPYPTHTYEDEIELREGAEPFPGTFAPPPPRRRYD